MAGRGLTYPVWRALFLFLMVSLFVRGPSPYAYAHFERFAQGVNQISRSS